MANTDKDVIFLGDRANLKQGIIAIPAQAAANKPALLNLQSVSGTTVSDNFLWLSSTNVLRQSTTKPTTPDSDGAAVGTTASSIGTGTPLTNSGYALTLLNTTQTSGVANLTIPDFAGVSQTFAFIALAQTLTNKTIDCSANTVTKVPAASLLIASQATGDILYASSASVWSRLGTGTVGQVLTAGGAGAAPSWQTASIALIPQSSTIEAGTYDLTLSTATQTTGAGALSIPDIAGATHRIMTVATMGLAAGDIFYYNGTQVVRLAKGSAAQTLKMNAGATAPEWVT